MWWKIFSFGNWRKARFGEKITKRDMARFYLSFNYYCSTFFLVKVILVKLKNLYIRHAWIFIMEKLVIKKLNGEKMVGFVKTFDHYHQKFNFDQFFSNPVELQENLNLKFSSNLDHDFTNHSYLPCAILKSFYSFIVKRAHEARDNQFLLKCSSFKMFNSWDLQNSQKQFEQNSAV